MYKFLFISCVLCISPFTAVAEQTHTSGSAPWAIQFHIEEAKRYKEQTTELNKTILQYLNDSDQSRVFNNYTKIWEQYVIDTCAVVAITSGTSGTRRSVYAAKCEEGLNYNRYFATKNALKCVKRVQNKKYIESGEKFHCLLQTVNIKVY
jgi:hypothetical protein